MKSLKAVTVTTKYCAGGYEESDSESSDGESSEEESSLSDGCTCIPIEPDSSESEDELPDHPSPLYFLSDRSKKVKS